MPVSPPQSQFSDPAPAASGRQEDATAAKAAEEPLSKKVSSKSRRLSHPCDGDVGTTEPSVTEGGTVNPQRDADPGGLQWRMLTKGNDAPNVPSARRVPHRDAEVDDDTKPMVSSTEDENALGQTPVQAQQGVRNSEGGKRGSLSRGGCSEREPLRPREESRPPPAKRAREEHERALPESGAFLPPLPASAEREPLPRDQLPGESRDPESRTQTTCEPRERQDVTKRRFRLTKEHFEEFGFTPSCSGCQHVATGLPPRGHTEECRKRVVEKLLVSNHGRELLEEVERRINQRNVERSERLAADPEARGSGVLGDKGCAEGSAVPQVGAPTQRDDLAKQRRVESGDGCSQDVREYSCRTVRRKQCLPDERRRSAPERPVPPAHEDTVRRSFSVQLAKPCVSKDMQKDADLPRRPPSAPDPLELKLPKCAPSARDTTGREAGTTKIRHAGVPARPEPGARSWKTKRADVAESGDAQVPPVPGKALLKKGQDSEFSRGEKRRLFNSRPPKATARSSSLSSRSPSVRKRRRNLTNSKA